MKAAKLIPLRRIAGTSSEMSDEALVAACAVGETAALGAFFDRHHTVVYRFLARISGCKQQDIDDLVQFTFLEAFRAAGKFRSGSTARTWLFGIAVNVVRHHVRGELRRRNLFEAVVYRPAPRVPTPDEIALHRQLVDRIRQALRFLPNDLRVAFVLCDLEEVRGVDAARLLGIREGTLWRRLHEARRALRRTIDQEGAT